MNLNERLTHAESWNTELCKNSHVHGSMHMPHQHSSCPLLHIALLLLLILTSPLFRVESKVLAVPLDACWMEKWKPCMGACHLVTLSSCIQDAT